MASYMRRSLLPRWPILIFHGEPSTPPSPGDYRLAELDLALPLRLAAAAGHPTREADHAFWRQGAAAATAVLHGGEAVGFFYARPGGIGPVAWSDDAHAAGVIDAALATALGQGGAVRVNVPGVAHAAVRHILARGMRLTSYGHILASESPGDLTRYLPSGGFLF
jgi:hypothetical protein